MLTYLDKLLYIIYHFFRVATFTCLSPPTSDRRGRRKHPCNHVVYDSKTSAVKYACESQNFCFAVKHQRSVRNTSGATLQHQKSQQRAPHATSTADQPLHTDFLLRHFKWGSSHRLHWSAEHRDSSISTPRPLRRIHRPSTRTLHSLTRISFRSLHS
jgi:hypothetical protein